MGVRTSQFLVPLRAAHMYIVRSLSCNELDDVSLFLGPDANGSRVILPSAVKLKHKTTAQALAVSWSYWRQQAAAYWRSRIPKGLTGLLLAVERATHQLADRVKHGVKHPVKHERAELVKHGRAELVKRGKRIKNTS